MYEKISKPNKSNTNRTIRIVSYKTALMNTYYMGGCQERIRHLTFNQHPKNEKVDAKNEDVHYAIEECQLLEHLELLQVSRSSRSIEVRFYSKRAA